MTQTRIHDHALQVLEFDLILKMLAGFAASDLGKQAARSLYPSTNRQWIRQRLAETSEMKTLLQQGVRIPLSGLRDIGKIIQGLGQKQTVFNPEELLDICDTLAASRRLKLFFSDLDPQDFQHLPSFALTLDEFTDLVNTINRSIDGRQGVLDHASEKLGVIRKHMRTLETKIRKEFRRITSSPHIRKALENNNFLIRHGRPVVAIKSHYRMYLRGTVLDRSNSGSTLYMEPDELVELSNELEDAHFEEKKEIDHILWQLTHAVLEDSDAITRSIKTLSFVDLAYAKARFSMDYQMNAPQLGDSVHLRSARHPLLLQWAGQQNDCPIHEAFPHIVPISPRLGDDFDLLLITGPNTGGKTVLLKTLGICLLMAQSGMHIPAHADSQITVYHQIFADIGDEQSIQQSLSTFSAHMRQVVHIIENTQSHTLILLDELGAGTDPTEGAYLATAILNDLLTRKGHTVATTHLGQLKTFAFTQARAENGSVQFDTQSLKPTYKLFIGTPGSSNALAIAQRLGMPAAVLKQAQDLLDQKSLGTTELINQVQTIRELAEGKRRKAQRVLDRAQTLRKQAAQRLNQIKTDQQQLRHQADHELDHSLHLIRKMLNQYRSTMANAPHPWSTEASHLIDQIEQFTASTPLAKRHQAFIDTLRKGDTVYVIGFRRSALVERIRRNKKTVVLQMDSKQLEVAYDQISKFADD
jgi:DNA mismatch repair protein MutS2